MTDTQSPSASITVGLFALRPERAFLLRFAMSVSGGLFFLELANASSIASSLGALATTFVKSRPNSALTAPATAGERQIQTERKAGAGRCRADEKFAPRQGDRLGCHHTFPRLLSSAARCTPRRTRL